ncbi:MAG: winged helix DNA-binding protein [Pseudomonadota bacterium]
MKDRVSGSEKNGPDRPATIVASPHLVSERASELSEFEYGLVLAANAFNRWIVRCMAAAGNEDLAALDIQVLHNLNHPSREKKLADICFVLNIEDSHTVNYALKKLLKMDLITGTRRGKEVFYTASDQGQALCAKYRTVREACLVDALEVFTGETFTNTKGEKSVKDLNQQIGDSAGLLRALSGLYDQAARSATSL